MLTWASAYRVFSPVYFFRPQQVFKRFWRELTWKPQATTTIRLPWGLPITIDADEAIGYNIVTRGLYDPVVTEVLWRLAGKGEMAVDAGANIGYTASVLGAKVAAGGRVLCFEPHPQVFSCLKSNAATWQAHGCGAQFELHQKALGAENGEAVLHTGDLFTTNRGTAWIGSAEKSDRQAGHPVDVVRLDGIATAPCKIGVLKIDVEGGELDVLRGMSRILAEHSVRDILFEETGEFPAPTHKYLRSMGYSIFGLEERFLGVRLLANSAPPRDPQTVPNYLATCDPDRALHLLHPPFWRSFGWMKFIGMSKAKA